MALSLHLPFRAIRKVTARYPFGNWLAMTVGFETTTISDTRVAGDMRWGKDEA